VKALYVINTQLDDALFMRVDVLHVAKAGQTSIILGFSSVSSLFHVTKAVSKQANALTHALMTGKS